MITATPPKTETFYKSKRFLSDEIRYSDQVNLSTSHENIKGFRFYSGTCTLFLNDILHLWKSGSWLLVSQSASSSSRCHQIWKFVDSPKKLRKTLRMKKAFYTYLGKACYWSSDLIHCIKLKEMTQNNVSWVPAFFLSANEIFMVIWTKLHRNELKKYWVTNYTCFVFD